MAKSTKTSKSAATRSKAKTIASQARDVRERVRDLIVDSVHKGRLRMNELEDVTRHVVEGAVEGVKKAVPRDADNVLRQVIDGVADGFAIAAHATGKAFDEARSRGATFARTEVNKSIKDLSSIEEQFVQGVTRAAKNVRAEASTQVHNLVTHAEHAAKSIRPHVKSAVSAAQHYPVKLVEESARAGIKASRQAAGTLALTISGLLQGAGDLLVGDDGKKSTKKTGKKTAGKK